MFLLHRLSSQKLLAQQVYQILQIIILSQIVQIIVRLHRIEVVLLLHLLQEQTILVTPVILGQHTLHLVHRDPIQRQILGQPMLLQEQTILVSPIIPEKPVILGQLIRHRAQQGVMS